VARGRLSKRARVQPVRGRAGRPARRTGQGARYTPPKLHPERSRVNKLYLGLFVVLLGAGVLAIVLNFLLILPGSQSAWYVLLGLALMASSFFAIARYR
jgi:hypothetical protein